MSTIDSYGMANLFIMRVVQDWPHISEKQAIDAVQTVLDAAGFVANATCKPVFGGIWPKPCTGPDGAEATVWLQELTDGLTRNRGDVNREIEYVKQVLDERITKRHP